MTAIKPVLDVFIDANILFLLAFLVWGVMQAVVLRSRRLRHDYPVQLRLLKTALMCTLLSPLLAWLAVSLGQVLWPKTPITVYDIAVASYLRGEIAMPAVEFEALLSTRSRAIEALLEHQPLWLTALIAGLTAGAVGHVLHLGYGVWRIRRAVARSYLLRRTKSVDLRLSDTCSVPFAARGLFRRHVVLPSSLVTHPRDLRYILAHEFQHLREGDIEWEIAFEALRPLMFWNPAFILWKRAFDRLRELGCDQSVIARRGIPQRAYSDCLLDFCQRRISGPAPRVLRVAFVRTGSRSAKQALQDRLLALQNTPVRRLRAAVPVLTCCLAVGLSIAAATVRESADWSHDKLMLSTIVNLERMQAMQINQGW